ncbi:hypothetical protein K443DRAFT_685534 [Laccaria amethystina LaAM-08-1]|uniref:Uncharacterized protein n=1 Tax=Laccaria amethystina LaAM-08-1 TaxID=1095629 RepID=A0A0C9WNJ4_9AGAR|nr:hypothetical protein K443DRAFT_685534 [Laccaria amethystina LaAM-08-1]
MLTSVEECGGESGKRYVVSAIIACGEKGRDEDVAETLAALGTTRLTHFLLPRWFHHPMMSQIQYIAILAEQQWKRTR